MSDTLKYSYDKPRQWCQANGMVFIEEWVPDIDAKFASLELDQEQVDELVIEYAHRIRWHFTPQNYSIIQRIKLALWFLFGRG